MGGATRLRFPLPHRRQKQQQQQHSTAHEVQSISAPMTNKAQKFLGTAEINVDATSSPTSPVDVAKAWETRSAVSGVSGISVTVSESTAAEKASVAKETATAAATKSSGKPGWDQESDIIPKGLGLVGSGVGRSHNLDTTTDGSSLRRRRSSSTIVSYYDKTKLPLSISQQTSSSAMAKGLPSRGPDLFSMESPRPAPSPPTFSKKKPGRLDFAHLLPNAASSSFARLARKGSMVLGPDMLTRSPSVMSSSPAVSPSAYDPKPEKKLRKKLTRESLKSYQNSRRERQGSMSSGPQVEHLRKPSTDAGNLHHLYEHYEQTSFRDTMPPEELAAPPSKRPGGYEAEVDSRTASRRDSRQSAPTSSPAAAKPRHYVSPSLSSVGWRLFPGFSPDEECGPISKNPRISVTSSNLASPPGEYATSVSSRHTRTSKASKRTESFADFDPNATSVLSLSSDSEDDYQDPPRTATSNQSVGSRDSMFSTNEHRRPSVTSLSQDSVRNQPKNRFRTSLSPQVPFLAIPEDEHPQSTTPAPPKINPRSSSLASVLTTDSPRPSTNSSSIHSQSRLSQASMSTTESVPTHFSRPRQPVNGSSPRQPPEIRHVAMLQSRAATPVQKPPGPISEKHSSPLQVAKGSQPTPPMSPSSAEFVIRGRRDPNSEHDGPILTLSGTDTPEEERLIAVTKQEEMLLAAMRAKRALMRENIQLGVTGGFDDGFDSVKGAAAKKESLSSIKTPKADTLQPPSLEVRPAHAHSGSKSSAKIPRFPRPPSRSTVGSYGNDDTDEQEQVLMCLDRTSSTMNPCDLSEPSPDLSDFIIDFDAEQFPAPPTTSRETKSHSRDSSAASAAGRLTHSKSKQNGRISSLGRPRPDSEFMPNLKPSSPVPTPPVPTPPVPSRKQADVDAAFPPEIAGHVRLKGRAMKDIIAEAFRAESRSTIREEDEDLVEEPEEPPEPPSRMKAVRISAVGLQLPEVGQWGDDG